MRKGNSESVKSTMIITTNLNGWKERASQSHVNHSVTGWGDGRKALSASSKLSFLASSFFVDRDTEGKDNLFLLTLSKRRE